MMLLCCSFVSASFTSSNPSSLSVDYLDSNIYTICRASLIATPYSQRADVTEFFKSEKLELAFGLFCTMHGASRWSSGQP